MFLDHNMITIIGRSFRWGPLETDAHIVDHYDSLTKLLLMKIIAFIDKNLPEKKQELMKKLNLDKDGNFIPHDNTEDATKAYETLTDQINLVLISYPELQNDIESAIFDIEKDLFLHYMKNGPNDGRLMIIEYLKKKISMLDRFPPALKLAETLIRDKEIREVLE